MKERCELKKVFVEVPVRGLVDPKKVFSCISLWQRSRSCNRKTVLSALGRQVNFREGLVVISAWTFMSSTEATNTTRSLRRFLRRRI